MSDVNFNVTTNKAGQGAGFVGSIQRNVSSVSADIDYSSATFADTGHTVTVTTVANEIATLSFTCMTAQITGVAGKALILAYKVDAGADVVITTYTQAVGNAADCAFSFALPALSAGSHTIKLRARVDSTPASYRLYGTAGGQSISELQIIQHGGGSKLSQKTETALSSDFSVTSASYANVTGSVVTVSTVPNETLLLTLTGYGYPNPLSLGGTLYLAYSVDGGSEVEILALSEPATVLLAGNVGFSIPVLIATAGSHTIQLRAKKGSPGDNWTLNGNIANGGVLRLNALQFGGNNSTSNWQSFTPTGAFTTNTTYTGKYRKVGDTLEVQARLAFAGAPNAATFTVSLPAGFTIDTTKLLNPTLGVTPIMGNGVALDTGILYCPIMPVYENTTSVRAVALFSSTGINIPVGGGFVTNSSPFTIGSTDEIDLSFSVPVL